MKLSMAGVFLIILIMSGCADPKPQAELLRTVMVSQVQAYDGQQSHVLSGVVQAAETSQLSFEVAGVVENVNVNLGDTIARGDKLARIESKVFELAVKQRQGQLSEIQARIKDAQKDVNRKKGSSSVRIIRSVFLGEFSEHPVDFSMRIDTACF